MLACRSLITAAQQPPQGGGAAGASWAAPGGTAGRGAGQTSGGAGMQGCILLQCDGRYRHMMVALLDEVLSCACLRTVSDPPAFLSPPCFLCRRPKPTRWLSLKRCFQPGPSKLPSGNEGWRSCCPAALQCCGTVFLAGSKFSPASVPCSLRARCSECALCSAACLLRCASADDCMPIHTIAHM